MAIKKKAVDPQKKLLITAIKKTIKNNSVLPITEDVYLTGEEAVMTDLETVVSIPFKTPGIDACVPANRLIDILEMMDKPKIEEIMATPPVPEHFVVAGNYYKGDLDTFIREFEYQKQASPELTESEFLENPVLGKNTFPLLTAEDMNPQPRKTLGIEFTEGKRSVKIMGEDPKDFPITPGTTEDAVPFQHIGTFGEKELGYLEEALTFVSKDDLRPAMTGIYCGSKIVATDAHRLVHHPIEPLMAEFILPPKATKILLALGGEKWEVYANVTVETTKSQPAQVKRFLDNDDHLDEDDRDYDWIDDPNHKEEVKEIEDFKNILFLREDGVQVITRKIDARYPDFECVIPQDKDHVARLYVEKEPMLRELKNAMKFANRATNQVKFCLNGKVEVSSQDIDFSFEYTNEMAKSEATVEFVGKKNKEELLEIGFNGVLLSQLVHQQSADEGIVMKFWGPSKAAIINDHYLLMPLMLNGDY